ncbi:T9SS type A sorting domain-containing protein [Candidatus Margulisiibacteriota bacterium]
MKKILAIIISGLLITIGLWAMGTLSVPSITIDSRSGISDVTGILDNTNTPLLGSGTTTGDIVQIISTGDDGNINVPNMVNGAMTGDDVLLATVNVGFGFPTSSNAGLFSKTVNVDPGKIIFIRAWDASSYTTSTYYGESVTYSVASSPNAQTFFAGVYSTSKNRDLVAPTSVPSFTAASGVRAANLSWQNSTSVDNLGTLVVRSENPITWTPDNYRDYLDSLDFNSYTALVITPGIKLVYTGAGTTAADTGLTANQTYYYAAFAYDQVFNYAAAVNDSAVPSSGISISSVIPFEYFQGTAHDASVELSWGVSTNVSGYTTVEIWGIDSNTEATSNYPASPTAPAVLIATANFADGTYTHSGLVNYRYYYYSIFAKQSAGTYSDKATTLVRPETASAYKAYNYPNPFAPGSGQATTIVFPLQSAGVYHMYLINMTGDVVWTSSGTGTAGSNTVAWNGLNDWGHAVPNGVYLLRVVKSGKVVASGKVSVLD